MYESGSLSYLDYLSAEQKYQEFESEKQSIDDYLKQMKISIKNQLSIEGPFELVSPSLNIKPIEKDLEWHLDYANNQRLDLKMIDLRKEIDEREARLRRPGTEVFLSGEYFWSGLSFPPSDDKEWRISLTASIPLYDFTITGEAGKQKVEPNIDNRVKNYGVALFNKNQITNKRIAETQKLYATRYESDINRLSKDIIAEVTQTFFEIQRTYNKFELHKKHKERLSKIKDVFEYNYKAGKEPEDAYFEFLLNQFKHVSDQARINFDFLIAYLKLKKACGGEML